MASRLHNPELERMTQVVAWRTALSNCKPVEVTLNGTAKLPDGLLPTDRFFVVPTTPKELRKGDLVLCTLGEHLAVRKVVRVYEEMGTTMVVSSDDSSEFNMKATLIMGRIDEIRRGRDAYQLQRNYTIAEKLTSWIKAMRAAG